MGYVVIATKRNVYERARAEHAKMEAEDDARMKLYNILGTPGCGNLLPRYFYITYRAYYVDECDDDMV